MDWAAWAERAATAFDSLPIWLVYVSACVGHGFWMIVAINVFYSYPIPHRVLKLTRRIDLLVVAAGPILFAYSLDLFGTRSLAWGSSSGRGWLSGYTVFCVGMGLVVAPISELRYLLRFRPAHFIREKTARLDVENELGYPPIGTARRASKCLLPLNQVFQVEFVEKTLALPKLPAAWEGLTILHLTDLHLCGTPGKEFFQAVLQRCKAWGTPDIIAVTGDVVDSEWHHRWVLPLLGTLRWNIAGLAILGNHDKLYQPELVRRRLARAGYTVLGNRWQCLTVRGEPMVVIGHEGPWFGPPPDLRTCVETERDHSTFRLCLSHTPDNLPWAKQNGVDLVLAGHVHGGQIRLPILGSVFVPSRFSRHYDCGVFFERPTLMHVGRGLSGQHPLRFFCPPEVTWITLTKTQDVKKL